MATAWDPAPWASATREDFSINECPVSVLQAEAGLEDTYAGSTVLV